jgi:hypothetical protein
MNQALSDVLLVVLGVPALVSGMFLALKFRNPNREREPLTPAGRICLAVSVSLSLSVGIGLGVRLFMPGTQVFEVSGLTRMISLPLGYLVFGVALLFPHVKETRKTTAPIWIGIFALVILASVGLSIVVPRQEQGFTAAAEGSAFVGGFLLVGILGSRAAEWTKGEEKRFLAILVGFACISGFSGVSLSPYVAVIAPASALLLYAGTRTRNYRLRLLLLGACLATSMLFPLLQSSTPSLTVQTQIAVSVGLLVLLWMPRGPRIIFAVAGTIGAVVVAGREGILHLLAGDSAGITDVTLTHRAYESAKVFELLQHDLVSALFGLGPAATVDLSWSPDARTLQSSGRLLGAVDDVHFLSSWMLLKFGILGLVCLVVILTTFAASVGRIFSEREVTVFDAALILFVATGTVASLTAATYFFSNPLPSLLIGVLYARARFSRTTALEAGFPNRHARIHHGELGVRN